MFCSNCGNAVDNDAKFCGNCGNAITSEPLAIETDHLTSKPSTIYKSKKKSEILVIGGIASLLLIMFLVSQTKTQAPVAQTEEQLNAENNNVVTGGNVVVGENVHIGKQQVQSTQSNESDAVILQSESEAQAGDEFKSLVTTDAQRLFDDEKGWANINYYLYVKSGQMTLDEAKVKMKQQINLCNAQTEKIEALNYKTTPAKEMLLNMVNMSELKCKQRQTILNILTTSDPVQQNELLREIEDIKSEINVLLENDSNLLKNNCPKFNCLSYLKPIE